MKPSAFAFLLAVAAVTAAFTSPAAADKITSQQVLPLAITSGARANSTGHEATVFSRTLDLGDAPWVRLEFGPVVLGSGSFLRITSRFDGAVQFLDQQALGEWQYSSAYFNGGAVTVELVAGPHSLYNSVSVARALAGPSASAAGASPEVPAAADRVVVPEGVESICRVGDLRGPSSDPRTARLLIAANDTTGVSGCTGFIIKKAPIGDPRNRCMLSAGHCFSNVGVLKIAEFNVPLSTIFCGLRHPAPKFQFPILPGARFHDNGRGDDWAVFICGRSNWKTVYEVMGEGFRRAAPADSDSTHFHRKYGFGDSGARQNVLNVAPDNRPCTCFAVDASPLNRRAQTQQTSAGTFISVRGSRIDHNLDTCGGDSGSPITQDSTYTTDVAVAIHTHGTVAATCVAGNYGNSGTDITDAALTAAIDSCASAFTGLPGTPTDGRDFVVKLREPFAIPFGPAGEPSFAFTNLPGPVVPGFVVLKDDPSIPDSIVSNWSDIVDFQSHAAFLQAVLISDPPGRPFTDADLAGIGLSLGQIRNGNTCYGAETFPVVRYDAKDTLGFVGTYFIYSDVDTLFPGTPLQGPGFAVVIPEPAPDPQEPIVAVPLPAPVQPGFVVLVDDSAAFGGGGEGPAPYYWSDIVFFPPSTVPPQAILISDQPGHVGFTDADLAPLGLTILDVQEGNTIYVVESGPPTIYTAVDTVLGYGAQYFIYSDLDPTATLASLVSAGADAGVAHVTWQLASAATVHAYRSTDGKSWSLVGTLLADGQSRVSLDDPAVEPGKRYGYRLGIPGATGERAAGETWLEIPLTASFALKGARPNPSTGEFSVSFSLLDGSAATLELIDLNGRRVLSREVGTLGPGFHVVALGREGRLPIGMYLVRVTQHGRKLTSKVSILR